MKITHAFLVAVIANIVGAYLYDAMKRGYRSTGAR